MAVIDLGTGEVEKKPVQTKRIIDLDSGQVNEVQRDLPELRSLEPQVQVASNEPESFRGLIPLAVEAFRAEDQQTRATEELPELGQGGLLSGEDAGTIAKVSPVLAVTTNPQEIAQILSANFPSVGIIEDEKGNLIAGNNKTGAQVVLNKPGFSTQDLFQLGAAATAFTPAGQAASIPTNVAARIGAGAIGAAATETGIQAAQEELGGEFTGGDIATSAAFGAASELLQPVVTGARSVSRPLEEVADETLQSALEKGTVLTTDVFPPKTFVGKAFQKVAERIPLAGTGGVRKSQQEGRQEVLEKIAQDFDIDVSSEFEKDIVNSANRVFATSQRKASKFRDEAVTALNELGDVPATNAINTIDKELADITALGAQGDSALAETLTNIKGELAGDFGRLKDIRTTIFNDISDIGQARGPIRSGGDAALTRVAGSLSKDLDDFAVNAGKSEGATPELAKAANKWRASNRIFKDNFAKARETELKKALTKGKVQPEVINSVLRGGKRSELTRLNRNLDLDGRKAARQQIIRDALERTGFPENPNPTRFLNELNRVNNKRAIETFFKGNDRAQLEGYKKFIDLTRRAQEAGASIATQQEVFTMASLGALGGGGAAVSGFTLEALATLGVAALYGVGGRAAESRAARNLLIKLSNPKLSTRRQKQFVDQLKPILVSLGREQAQMEVK